MFQACIFDLDGTLAYTLESISSICNQILDKFHLPALPIEDFRYYVGDGGNVLMERCFRAVGADFTHLAEGQQMYREMMAENPLYKVTVYDGIKEMLLELKKRNVKLAVLSNKPHEGTCGVIKGLFGDGIFDIVQGLEIGMKKKPATDGALAILKKLGVDAESCMYVGDTNTDMQTGKSAGMYTIGVLWGFRDYQELKENHADVIIEHPTQLLTIQENNK